MSEKREREKKMGKTQKDSSCSSDLKVHRLRRGDFIPISLLFFFFVIGFYQKNKMHV